MSQYNHGTEDGVSITAFLYVLESTHLPGWCKVGKTTRSVEQRAAELSTGVPGKLSVYAECPTNDCHEAEKQAHRALARYRNGPRDEWFRIPAKEATAIIRDRVGVRARRSATVRSERALLALVATIAALIALILWPVVTASAVSALALTWLLREQLWRAFVWVARWLWDSRLIRAVRNW